MEAIENKEIRITLTDEDVRLAIRDFIWKSYPDMGIKTTDIKMIGNNDEIKANLIIVFAENPIPVSVSFPDTYKVDKEHPDYKGDLGRG